MAVFDRPASDAAPVPPARLVLSQAAAFWVLGALLGMLMFASSAPSPLYWVYQAQWHFSAMTLTAVFAVYAITLLIALLVTGSLSHYLGRRPHADLPPCAGTVPHHHAHPTLQRAARGSQDQPTGGSP
jgi:hypothetical protein